MTSGSRRGGSAEVLAPAGSVESLQAAVRCGADAVYLGGKALNARRNAANFDGEQLRDAVKYCHIRGVKVYLTLNTLVFGDEWPEARDVLKQACESGVDALIVQDLGLASIARECAPGMELHASTQMSVHNAAGARLLEQLGFSRVVLAREMTREELRRIREETSLELECFVHGALCMSVSGQCYLSAMLGGRSGNRGLCAQPCRLPFSGGGKEFALSLKDLSLIERIRELEDMGIGSLKIEGRMKRPEYVAAAVTACRDALEGKQPDYAALEAVFSRSGFTDGYFTGKRGGGMFGVRDREDVQSAEGVLKKLALLYKNERQSVPVDFTAQLRRDQPLALTVADWDGHVVEQSGSPPEEALSAPTTEEKLSAALCKTGGTPYRVERVNAVIDDGVMVPAARLNALRRDALDRLSDLRGTVRPVPFACAEREYPAEYSGKRQPLYRVRLSRAAQLTEKLARLANELILPVEEFGGVDDLLLRRYRDKVLMEIPSVAFNNLERLNGLIQSVMDRGVFRAIGGTLGSVAIGRDCGLEMHGGHELNVVNAAAVEQCAGLGLQSITASIELDAKRLRKLGGGLSRGILAYGCLPLMSLRNCPAGDCKSCRRSFPELTDRKGKRFFLDCQWRVAKLYNPLPLWTADKQAELTGVDFLTLFFTRETPEACVEVLEAYRRGDKYDGEFTRGLLFRRVQ